MSAVERLAEKVGLAVRVRSYLKRTPTGHIEPVVAHERTGAPGAPPGITPLGPPPPEALTPPEPAPASQEAIQAKTHSVDDVVSGKYAVGVEGSGGKDLEAAKAKGLYTTKVENIPIFAKDEKAARPVVNYLKAGGKYGSTEFSRLLGYSRKEIAEYERYLRSKGHEDLIEPEVALARVQWDPYLRKTEHGVEQVAGHVRLLDLEEVTKPSRRAPEPRTAPSGPYGAIPQEPSPVPMPKTDLDALSVADRKAVAGYLYGDTEAEELRKGIVTAQSRALSAAIEKSRLAEPTRVYRAIPADVRTDIISQARAGYTDRAFGSTTANPRYAAEWQGSANVIAIDLPAGTPALDIEKVTGYGKQSELLLDRDMKLVFGGWDENGLLILKPEPQKALSERLTPAVGRTQSGSPGIFTKAGVRTRVQSVVDRMMKDLGGPKTKVTVVEDPDEWYQTWVDNRDPSIEHTAGAAAPDAFAVAGKAFVGPNAVRDLREVKGGLTGSHMVAHELAHTLSGVDTNIGLAAIVEEGAAETVAVAWLGQNLSEEFINAPYNERTLPNGDMAQGVDRITSDAVYQERVTETIMTAIRHKGFDREAVLADVRAALSGDRAFREKWFRDDDGEVVRYRADVRSADVYNEETGSIDTIDEWAPDPAFQQMTARAREAGIDPTPYQRDMEDYTGFLSYAPGHEAEAARELEGWSRALLGWVAGAEPEVKLARTWVGPYLRPGEHGIEWVDPHWRTYERGAPLPPAAAPRRPAPERPVLSRDRRDYPKNWDPTPYDVGRWQEGELPTPFLADIAMRNEESLQTKREYEYQDRWEEFVKDIRANGIREPILVMVNDSRDTRRPAIQIEGHRRLLAARELGLERVPVEVRYFGTQGAPGGPDLFVDAGLVEPPPAADLTPRELQNIEDEIARFKREGMGPAPTAPPEPVPEPEPESGDIIDRLNSDVFYAAHYYDSFEFFRDRYNARTLNVLPHEGWTKGDQDKFVYAENYTEEGLREVWDRAHAPDQVPGWAPTPVGGYAYIPVKRREGESDSTFRIRQMERRRVEVLTEPNERGDVIVWDGTEAQVVKHKNLLRSPFRMMLPNDTSIGQVHAIVADPERGRIYAVVSGNRVIDGEVVEEAKLRLQQMIELNRTVEADVGLRNKWNGTLQIGIEERELRKGAGGVKEWGCAIAVDVGVLDTARRARLMQDRGIPEAAGRTDQETTQLLIHELVHGMSAAVPGSNKFMYMGNAAMEEGVAEGYTTALLQVQRNGPDSPAFGPGGDLTTLPGTDWHAYSEWVEGLDHVFGDTTVDEEHPLGVMTGRLTAGQRLEFYRDMLKTRLQGRERKVRSISKRAGFNTWFEGRGLGSEMKFVHTRRPESPFYRESEPVREPTTTRSPMHDAIYAAETPEEARAIYPEIKDYLATAPADAGPVSRDAEALVHLGTADGRTLSGEFDRPGAEDYAATWEELPDKVYHVAPVRSHDAIVAEGLQPQGHAWNFALSESDREEGGYWDPETKTYVGPGSDRFGWRPEAAYVFADKSEAASMQKYFAERHGEEFEVFEVDALSILRQPESERPAVIKDPEQIQTERDMEQENADEGEEIEPSTSDEIFDRLAESEDPETGEAQDQRQWAIEQVPPQFVRPIPGWEYKEQENWDDEDWEEYSEAHPEEFPDEEELPPGEYGLPPEELEPPIVKAKEFTPPTNITDLKPGDKVTARRSPNTKGRTFTVVRVSEKAGMVETLDDAGRPRNFTRGNVMQGEAEAPTGPEKVSIESAKEHTLDLQQASAGSRHFIATCSCGWQTNPQTQGRARGAWKRHAAAHLESLKQIESLKEIAPEDDVTTLRKPLEGHTIKQTRSENGRYFYLQAYDDQGNQVAELSWTRQPIGVTSAMVDSIRVDPAHRGRGLAIALIAEMHDRTGLTIEHGSFASPEGARLGVFMSSHYPDWNRLWLGVDTSNTDPDGRYASVYWNPGDPITGTESTFDPMSDGSPEYVRKVQTAVAKGLEGAPGTTKVRITPGQVRAIREVEDAAAEDGVPNAIRLLATIGEGGTVVLDDELVRYLVESSLPELLDRAKDWGFEGAPFIRSGKALLAKLRTPVEPLEPPRVRGKAIAPLRFDPSSEDPAERAHTPTGLNDPVPEGYVRLYRGVSDWTSSEGDEHGVWFSNTYKTAVSYANLGSGTGEWGGPMRDPTKSSVLAVDVPVSDVIAYAADAGHDVDAEKAAIPDEHGGIEVRVPFAVAAKAGVIEGQGMTVSEFLEVSTHVADLNDASALLWAAEMRDQGVSIADLANDIRSMLTDEYLAEGRVWYPDALDVAADISKDSGIGLDRVVTAIAVMSPRCQWEDPESGEGEKKYVRSLAKFVASGGTDGLNADEAAVAWKKHYKETNTVLGLVKGKRTGDPVGASVFNNNTAKAIRVMRGEVTPGELLIDNKTRSFYDNIMFPQDPSAVTIDTHMMKVFERVYGVTYKDADMFSRHDRKVPKGGGQVRGIGYIALSEAIRQVAAETGETPNAIQAAYWLRMQSEPHILENGQPWPGRDPVLAFALALDYLDTDFELRPAYSPEEVAQNRLTDAEVEEVFEREQEEADRYERPVGLARVDVIRHLRLVRGKVQDVAAHQRKLDIESLLAEPAPAPAPGGPKYTIGTLHPDDQEVIRAMLPRLSARYPSAAKQIRLVTAATFTGRWASFHDEGTMKFNNMGAKYIKKYGEETGNKYRDKDLASTVTHEFGHAVMQDLSGGVPTADMRKEIKAIDAKLRKMTGRKGKLRYLPNVPEVQERNIKVRAVNDEIHEQQMNTNRLLKEVMGRVRDALSEGWENEPAPKGASPEGQKMRVTSQRLHDQIVEEFAEMPEYVLSSQEELFAQAFAHFEMGRRGLIADTVGEWVQEKYGKVEQP